jgi:hypothetical protein
MPCRSLLDQPPQVAALFVGGLQKKQHRLYQKKAHYRDDQHYQGGSDPEKLFGGLQCIFFVYSPFYPETRQISAKGATARSKPDPVPDTHKTEPKYKKRPCQ